MDPIFKLSGAPPLASASPADNALLLGRRISFPAQGVNRPTVPAESSAAGARIIGRASVENGYRKAVLPAEFWGWISERFSYQYPALWFRRISGLAAGSLAGGTLRPVGCEVGLRRRDLSGRSTGHERTPRRALQQYPKAITPTTIPYHFIPWAGRDHGRDQCIEGAKAFDLGAFAYAGSADTIRFGKATQLLFR